MRNCAVHCKLNNKILAHSLLFRMLLISYQPDYDCSPNRVMLLKGTKSFRHDFLAPKTAMTHPLRMYQITEAFLKFIFMASNTYLFAPFTFMFLLPYYYHYTGGAALSDASILNKRTIIFFLQKQGCSLWNFLDALISLSISVTLLCSSMFPFYFSSL